MQIIECNEGFEVFKAVTMKNAVFWDVAAVLVTTSVSEESVTFHLQGKKNPIAKKIAV
jgi:hypothetical protein